MAADATVWLRDRGLPEFLTSDCSLCECLRSDHGVKLDSADYFAGRVIDQWVELEVRPSIPAGIEIGVAYALFHVYRQRDPPRQKPRPAKHLAWGDAAAHKFIKLPGTSDRERWLSITEDFEVFVDGRRRYVSRGEDEKGIERL